MQKDFYKEWFGIPEKFRPVTHYQLLGLKSFETDPEKIDQATRDRMRILQKYQVGKYAEASVQLMMELSIARAELLNAAAKSRYDASVDETVVAETVAPEGEWQAVGQLDVFKSIVEMAVFRGGIGPEYVLMLEAQAERLNVPGEVAGEIIDEAFAERERARRRHRWITIAGIAAVVLVVLVLAQLIREGAVKSRLRRAHHYAEQEQYRRAGSELEKVSPFTLSALQAAAQRQEYKALAEAKELYAHAGAYEQKNPQNYAEIMIWYRRVVEQCPTTSYAQKAREKVWAIERRAEGIGQNSLEQGKNALAEGRYAEAAKRLSLAVQANPTPEARALLREAVLKAQTEQSHAPLEGVGVPETKPEKKPIPAEEQAKYETAMAEGDRLLGAEKWEEAEGAFQKALAVPGFEDDEKAKAGLRAAKEGPEAVRKKEKYEQSLAAAQAAYAKAKNTEDKKLWLLVVAYADLAIGVGHADTSEAYALKAEAAKHIGLAEVLVTQIDWLSNETRGLSGEGNPHRADDKRIQAAPGDVLRLRKDRDSFHYVFAGTETSPLSFRVSEFRFLLGDRLVGLDLTTAPAREWLRSASEADVADVCFIRTGSMNEADREALKRLRGGRLAIEITVPHYADVSPVLQHLNPRALVLTYGYYGRVDLHDLEDISRLSNLSVLEFGSNSVADLSPLAKLPQLASLDLCCRQLSSVSVLEKLPGLVSLEMRDCDRLSDISPLTKLPNLVSLSIYGAKQIKDISVLEKLPNLTRLYLSGFEDLSEVSVVGKLRNLTSLNLSGCKISDLSILRELRDLTSLEIGSQGISDISDLQQLPKLTSLSLRDCSQLRDISVLAHLPDLTYLNLYRCMQITDISVLARLTNLTSLNLFACHQIRDISAITSLPNLTSLNIVGCTQIRDISALGKLRNLRSLQISGSGGVSDFSFLASLPNLVSFYAGGTRIRDLSVVEKLPNLRSLSIGDRETRDISMLEKMPNLTSLNLSGCTQLTDISALAKLPALTSLNLFQCPQIRDISVLAKLPDLTSLRIHGCDQIRDISVLETLPDLTCLVLFSCSQIDDVSVLAKLPYLSSVSLGRCDQVHDLSALNNLQNLAHLDLPAQTTDEQLLAIAKQHPRLVRLSLYGCDKITPDGIEAVKRALPYCQISEPRPAGSATRPPGTTTSIPPTRESIPPRNAPGGPGDLYTLSSTIPFQRDERIFVRRIAWSPDGKTILFSMWDFRPSASEKMFSIDLDGKRISPWFFPEAEEPAFSPDGKSVAVTFRARDQVQHWGIRIVDLVTREKRECVKGLSCFPSFTHDGRRICYVSKDNLWVTEVDGSGQKQVTSGCKLRTEIAVSPMEDLVAYVSEKGDEDDGIWVRRIDGEETATQITSEVGSPASLAWSPDGQIMSYVYKSQVWVTDKNGKNKLQLTTEPHTAARTHTWSPDGAKMICSFWVFGLGGPSRDEFRILSLNLPLIHERLGLKAADKTAATPAPETPKPESQPAPPVDSEKTARARQLLSPENLSRAGKLLLYNDFAGGGTTEWEQNANVRIERGVLILQTTQKGVDGRQTWPGTKCSRPFDDFVLALTFAAVHPMPKSPRDFFRVIFRSAAPEHGYGYYLLALNEGSSGLLRSQKVPGGKYTAMGTGLPAPLWNGERNRIEIFCLGSTVDCWVNGSHLGEQSDATFSGGSVGLMGFGDGVRFEVDEVAIFEVKRDDASGAPLPGPAKEARPKTESPYLGEYAACVKHANELIDALNYKAARASATLLKEKYPELIAVKLTNLDRIEALHKKCIDRVNSGKVKLSMGDISRRYAFAGKIKEADETGLTAAIKKKWEDLQWEEIAKFYEKAADPEDPNDHVALAAFFMEGNAERWRLLLAIGRLNKPRDMGADVSALRKYADVLGALGPSGQAEEAPKEPAQTTPAAGKTATIYIVCDDEYVLFINGKEIARGNDLRTPGRHKTELQQGDLVEVKVTDNGGAKGLVCAIDLGNGKMIVTDESWSYQEQDGWHPAVQIGPYLYRGSGWLNLGDVQCPSAKIIWCGGETGTLRRYIGEPPKDASTSKSDGKSRGSEGGPDDRSGTQPDGAVTDLRSIVRAKRLLSSHSRVRAGRLLAYDDFDRPATSTNWTASRSPEDKPRVEGGALILEPTKGTGPGWSETSVTSSQKLSDFILALKFSVLHRSKLEGTEMFIVHFRSPSTYLMIDKRRCRLGGTTGMTTPSLAPRWDGKENVLEIRWVDRMIECRLNGDVVCSDDDAEAAAGTIRLGAVGENVQFKIDEIALFEPRK